MSETRKQARALLAAATKSPWQECGIARCGCGCGNVWSVPSDVPVASATRVWEGGEFLAAQTNANAALIAAAPTLIATLCDEADAAEVAVYDANERALNIEFARGSLRVEIANVQELLEQAESDRDALRAERDQLRNACARLADAWGDATPAAEVYTADIGAECPERDRDLRDALLMCVAASLSRSGAVIVEGEG